jgi:protein-disulfide isomerase
MKRHLVTAAIALVAGFAGAGLWSLSGLGHFATRDYLVANPGILPDMAEALDRQESAAALAELGEEVGKPFPGAVLGNPQGSKTIVKFTDYACGFCRTSAEDVERLITADPEVRVVVREWPIFEGSEEAARVALAAAAKGRYPAFYRAMFAAGPPSPSSIEAAARAAGLRSDELSAMGSSDPVTRELAQTDAMARRLGFTGTPSWVIGDEVLQGAVGHEALEAALDRADEDA